MATNEKILQTRIVNKHALLTDWQSSTLPLKEGEIALAKVMVKQKDGTEAPTYIAKVGVDGKTFNESALFYAPASDVYSWAKAETKPTYNATEIALTDGSTVEAEINTLKSAIGEGGSVDEQIAAAITTALDALDLSEVTVGTGKIISTIKQENGKVTVTTRDLAKEDIPTIEITQVNGLEAALAEKAVETSVAQRFTAVATRLDSGDIHEAIVAAKAAGDNAQDAIDAYVESNDAALALVKATAEAATTVGEAEDIADAAVAAFNTATIVPLDQRVTANATAISTEKSRAEGVESGLDSRLTTVEGKVDALSSATHFLGVKTELPATGANGDIVIVGNKEYVYDAASTAEVKWVELGDTTAELAAIDALEKSVADIQADLGAEGDTTKAIQAAKDAADAAQDTADANTAAIEVINGTGAGSISKAVADATAALQTYADTAEADALKAAKEYTDGEVDKLEQADTNLTTKIDNHIADKNNPHGVTATQIGVGAFENKTFDDIKTAFTGAVAAGDTGFVTGGAVNTAITEAVDVVDQKATNNATDISTIKNNYARVSGDQLVCGQGDAEMVIVFDCGGAE